MAGLPYKPFGDHSEVAAIFGPSSEREPARPKLEAVLAMSADRPSTTGALFLPVASAAEPLSARDRTELVKAATEVALRGYAALASAELFGFANRMVRHIH